MFFDEFQRAYRKRVRERIAEVQVFLGQGKAKDFEEYRKWAGEIAGLEKALDLFGEIIKQEIDEGERDD